MTVKDERDNARASTTRHRKFTLRQQIDIYCETV